MTTSSFPDLPSEKDFIETPVQNHSLSPLLQSAIEKEIEALGTPDLPREKLIAMALRAINRKSEDGQRNLHQTFNNADLLALALADLPPAS